MRAQQPRAVRCRPAGSPAGQAIPYASKRRSTTQPILPGCSAHSAGLTPLPASSSRTCERPQAAGDRHGASAVPSPSCGTRARTRSAWPYKRSPQARVPRPRTCSGHLSSQTHGAEVKHTGGTPPERALAWTRSDSRPRLQLATHCPCMCPGMGCTHAAGTGGRGGRAAHVVLEAERVDGRAKGLHGLAVAAHQRLPVVPRHLARSPVGLSACPTLPYPRSTTKIRPGSLSPFTLPLEFKDNSARATSCHSIGCLGQLRVGLAAVAPCWCASRPSGRRTRGACLDRSQTPCPALALFFT